VTPDQTRYELVLKRLIAAIDARDDMLAFTRLMMPVPGHEAGPGLFALCSRTFSSRDLRGLEELEKGAIKRLIISLPPRHGKTQLASKMFPAWYAGRNPLQQPHLRHLQRAFRPRYWPGRARRDAKPAIRPGVPGDPHQAQLRGLGSPGDRTGRRFGLRGPRRHHHRARRRRAHHRRSAQRPPRSRQPDHPGHALDLVHAGHRVPRHGPVRPDHADPDPLAPGRPGGPAHRPDQRLLRPRGSRRVAHHRHAGARVRGRQGRAGPQSRTKRYGPRVSAPSSCCPCNAGTPAASRRSTRASLSPPAARSSRTPGCTPTSRTSSRARCASMPPRIMP
jgi:hypothetical protein